MTRNPNLHLNEKMNSTQTLKKSNRSILNKKSNNHSNLDHTSTKRLQTEPFGNNP